MNPVFAVPTPVIFCMSLAISVVAINFYPCNKETSYSWKKEVKPRITSLQIYPYIELLPLELKIAYALASAISIAAAVFAIPDAYQ